VQWGRHTAADQFAVYRISDIGKTPLLDIQVWPYVRLHIIPTGAKYDLHRDFPERNATAHFWGFLYPPVPICNIILLQFPPTVYPFFFNIILLFKSIFSPFFSRIVTYFIFHVKFKYNTSVNNTTLYLYTKIVYFVRATCFDLIRSSSGPPRRQIQELFMFHCIVGSQMLTSFC